MIAFRYALLRFLPFVETGEFANVGVVLIGASDRYFDFMLLKQRTRVVNFFELKGNKVFQRGLKNVGNDLDRIKTQLRHADPRTVNLMFDEVTRYREAVFRFDKPRALLADDAEQALKNLFDRYIVRNFVTSANQEALIEQSLRGLLIENQLTEKFRPRIIGDDLFKVSFPFVKGQAAQVRVIKPLHLTHVEASKAFDYGLQWAGRVAELKNRNLLDGRVLFALKSGEATKNQEAAAAVRKRIISVGAEAVEYTETHEIISFASAA